MTDRTLASHLEFYGSQNVSPVRQDISDFAAHLQRRRALYRQLGILPSMIADAEVCEVGPGSGYNSLYIGHCRPRRFVLVEGNPTGIADMRRLFADHPEMAGAEIHPARIEDYRNDGAFDLVLCEGVLSGVPNPEEVLAGLARLVRPGGLLVTTCVDHLSHYAEMIRRLIAQRAVDPALPLHAKVEIIEPIFAPHLVRLGFVSRRHDDWIIDNLIHPGSIIPLVNIPETIVLLAAEFQFFGASPRFAADWRWYKSIVAGNWDFNIPAIAEYWRNCHNLLDHRSVHGPRDEAANQRLYDLCTQARAAVAAFEATREDSHIRRFARLHSDIVADAETFSADTAMALAEGGRLAIADRIDAQAVANAADFGGLFGRGQQYVSFTRES